MQTNTAKQNVTMIRGERAAGPFTLRKRIGSIVYEVEVHFNPDTKERMNDKKLRLIRRDAEAA